MPMISSKELRGLTNLLISCSNEIVEELGIGWKEEIYQRAMEIALRQHGLSYETQRILPVTFSGHVIGDSIPDLVIWLQNRKNRTAVVIDLKTEPDIKNDHRKQVEKYIRELRKQVRPNEFVSPLGLVINFVKEANNGAVKNDLLYSGKVQLLKVKG